MIRQEKIGNKGITLVALVVTIIILIILAGVSINAIIGENGVITLAKRAKENIELAQIEEQESLNQLFDDFELQESQIEGTGSYAAVLKLNEFKKKIADYIDEAANGSIDLTTEYVKPDYNTASIEAFGLSIKQIVKEATKGATATAEDIREGKTAWVNGRLITGTYVVPPELIPIMTSDTTPKGRAYNESEDKAAGAYLAFDRSENTYIGWAWSGEKTIIYEFENTVHINKIYVSAISRAASNSGVNKITISTSMDGNTYTSQATTSYSTSDITYNTIDLDDYVEANFVKFTISDGGRIYEAQVYGY